MKKVIAVVGFIVLVGVTGLYLASQERADTEQMPSNVDTSTWQAYSDPETGFSIKYPPQYYLEADAVATNIPWVGRGLLTIYREKKSVPQTTRPQFGNVVAQVSVE